MENHHGSVTLRHSTTLRTVAQGQARRTKGTSTPQGDLGDPNTASVGRAGAGTCPVQSGGRSELRSCDLLKLRVKDLTRGDCVAARAIVLQQETARPVQFEITEQTRESVAAWISHAGRRPEDFLFTSRLGSSPHLSTRQYARTHTLRRTKAALIYRRTKNLRAKVQCAT